jgi:hypothetical protein
MRVLQKLTKNAALIRKQDMEHDFLPENDLDDFLEGLDFHHQDELMDDPFLEKMALVPHQEDRPDPFAFLQVDTPPVSSNERKPLSLKRTRSPDA